MVVVDKAAKRAKTVGSGSSARIKISRSNVLVSLTGTKTMTPTVGIPISAQPAGGPILLVYWSRSSFESPRQDGRRKACVREAAAAGDGVIEDQHRRPRAAADPTRRAP